MLGLRGEWRDGAMGKPQPVKISAQPGSLSIEVLMRDMDRGHHLAGTAQGRRQSVSSFPILTGWIWTIWSSTPPRARETSL
jgi:hypothetical protein